MANKPLITSVSEGKIGQVKDLVGHAIRNSAGMEDAQLQLVNENGGRFQEAFLVFFGRFLQTLTGLFKGVVDYDRDRAELLEDCGFDWQYLDLPIEEWPVRRRGQHSVEIREEHLGEYLTVAQIDARLADDEEDADPVAVLEIFGRQNRDRQCEHPLVTFFTARGQRWCLILYGGVVRGRLCGVSRVSPRRGFHPSCGGLRVRQFLLVSSSLNWEEFLFARVSASRRAFCLLLKAAGTGRQIVCYRELLVPKEDQRAPY